MSSVAFTKAISQLIAVSCSFMTIASTCSSSRLHRTDCTCCCFVTGTPELAPDPNFSMVSPEQLNQALQSYWASVQHLQGLIAAGSTQTTPRMTPQHTPGYLTPQRSLARSERKSPLPSPRKKSPLGSPRVMSPMRAKAAGYEVMQ